MTLHNRAQGGDWFPSPKFLPRSILDNVPLVWRLERHKYIQALLVTGENPGGSITNSDLELVGGLLHLDAIAQHYNVHERMLLSKTDNIASLFWKRKGSSTTDKVLSHLLLILGLRERFHRYAPAMITSPVH